MSDDDLPPHDLAALDDLTLAGFIDISDIVIVLDRADPSRQALMWGRERLTFLIHMQEAADVRIGRFSLDLRAGSAEVDRMIAAVIASKGSCDFIGHRA
jgi:hypothetical protein